MIRARNRLIIAALLVCAAYGLILSTSGADEGTGSGYLAVAGPCDLAFPRDHGAHPGYKTEWWYYTGNVQAEAGEDFGFQLTIFRVQIAPPGSESRWPDPTSHWRTQQLYLAHAAVTDIRGGHHYSAESMVRGALGMADAVSEQDVVSLFVKDWSITISPRRHDLTAHAENFAFSLSAVPLKQPVPHGDGGYSRKGNSAERASCYYSFTRMDVSGDLELRGRSYAVKGLGWMDHEFSTAPLEPGLTGWDWFSLQLNDDTEIMLFLLRDKTGVRNELSSGTFVRADGSSTSLSGDAFSVSVTGAWVSPRTKGRYPAGWKLAIPELSLELELAPSLADQEMSTSIRYWEGAVTITGRKGGAAVAGSGYVELTGYAKPFDAPL